MTFIAVHVWLWSQGQLPRQLDIEVDGSIPEMFNYLKWAASAVACAYTFSLADASRSSSLGRCSFSISCWTTPSKSTSGLAQDWWRRST